MVFCQRKEKETQIDPEAHGEEGLGISEADNGVMPPWLTEHQDCQEAESRKDSFLEPSREHSAAETLCTTIATMFPTLFHLLNLEICVHETLTTHSNLLQPWETILLSVSKNCYLDTLYKENPIEFILLYLAYFI